VRGKAQASGRRLSEAIYAADADIDGLLYPSRLTSGDCIAVYDRSVGKLTAGPVHDVLAALETGRAPVVITERRDHLALLAGRLSKFAKNVIVLSGGMGVSQARAVAQRLAEIPETDERVIVATGRYLGEGFDDPRLDTLFLTLPISWRGTLAQYAGRLQRAHANKRDVIIYDYADVDEPLLAKMAVKREAGYRSLGFDICRAAARGSGRECLREHRPIGRGAVVDRP
jgi:hypothetical protein